MIDWQQVITLRDEVGADDFDEVIALFLQEVEEVTTRLSAGTPSYGLEQDLHFLKGSAMSLGFTAFCQACDVGERLAAGGQSDQVALPDILACYRSSKSQFLGHLPKAIANQTSL